MHYKYPNSSEINCNIVKFNNYSGYMIICFSQPLAILPYILRSLRLLKMNQARDIYWETGVIPKNMIRNWN